ncbi:MAG TPA: hypothetical protein ENJ61_00235 [Aquifex aeolicus]|uniref:Conjugal transfer protein TraF n=1 Tax=Aquifex aeolicus TaxID=63363 RepID=A0A7C5Q1J4_AQUAO|nr:hypothetical protein [Aquifex aeolicus]
MVMGVFLFLLTGVVFASTCEIKYFFKDRERGWFWRNLCIEEERKGGKKKEGKDLTVKIPWDRLDEMKPSEIRKLREEALEIAVANPTYENVRELYRLHVWMLRKSERFQRTADLVVMTDPVVAGFVGKVADAKPARVAHLSARRDEMYRKVVSYRKRAGLLIAVTNTCPYCRALKDMIRLYFLPRTGWSVKYIDIEKNPGFARNLQVYTVPDIFLAVMGEKPFILRIATGFVSYETLIERIYTGLEIYEKGGLKYEEVSAQ